jgi:hypothetical protein
VSESIPPPGVWAPDMGEISGFGEDGSAGGRRYEECCRAMLRGGLAWLAEHPDADPRFHGYEGVYGILEDDNDDAKALSLAVVAPARAGGGASGAMHQAVIGHLLFIKAHGWPAYVARMREPESEQ